MKTVSKWAAALALLAIATAACGDNGPTALPTASPSASATATTSTRFPVVGESVKVDRPAPPVGQRQPACPGVQYRFPRTVDPKRSFVIALVDPYRGFGPDCPKLRNGATCSVPFQGSWRLEETQLGSVVFEIFEDESSVAAHSVEFGPIGPRGNFSRSLAVTYKVGAKARYVTFRALLRSATGEFVAESPPQTVPIPSCVN